LQIFAGKNLIQLFSVSHSQTLCSPTRETS
jgi:hypothetical protein